MRTIIARTFLVVTTLGFAATAPSLSAAPSEGWSKNLQSEVVNGCVGSLKDAVTMSTRQQLGLQASEPLPEETRKTLESDMVPEFRKTCSCTVERVAERHSYQEVQSNPALLEQEAAKVGKPGGCPLNLPS